jgi:formylglycine-generating enzyme required for sulfatase activity
MTVHTGIRRSRHLLAAAFLLLSLSGTALGAPVRVAVLELGNPAGLTDAEVAYLSDQVRTAVAATLPVATHLVMTRESIQELLPPGVSMKDCLDAVCEVEIGRTIGADYVVSGEVLVFGGEYRLILKAHDCDTAAFLTSRSVGAAQLPELEAKVPDAAGPVALKLRRPGGSTGVFPVPGAPPPDTDWFPELGGTAVVRFVSRPAGAAVWVDGRLVCTETPCSREVPTGLLTITMERDRHRPRQDMVTIMPDSGAVEIVWDLTPDYGWLDTADLPAGLIFTVDGVAHTAGGTGTLELDAGYHTFEVTDPRYRPASADLRIEPGRRARPAIDLVPREGALQLGAVDADSNAVVVAVRIDGRRAGATPLTERLLVGRHLVELQGEAGRWRGEVEILEQETTVLVAPLAAGWRGAASEGLVALSAGSFLMGSPPYEKERERDEDRHEVTLTRPFLLGATEVTQAQWREVMGTNPSEYRGDDHPVEQVDWYDAVRFCNALSRREQLTPAYRIDGDQVVWDRDADGYRLPTEAEWEYACRAGSDTRFAGGDRAAHLREQAWYRGSAGDGTRPVASLAANAWGLHDMHGNVWEWCWNWSAAYPSRFATDPIGPAGGRSRVIRGGAWNSPAASCRSAKHNAAAPEMRMPTLGLRVARNAPEGW